MTERFWRRSGGCWPTATQRLLLRAALLPGAAAAEAWREWRAIADPRQADESSSYLLPLLAGNLGPQVLSQDDFGYVRSLHHLAWAANMRRLTSLAQLLRDLRTAGIETLLLKGAALVATHYGDAGLRPMADVDVLVRADQARAAMRRLRELAWRPLGWAEFSRTPEMTIAVRHSHAYEHDDGQQLDLHWHVLWDCCDAGTDEAFWRRSVTIRCLDAETRSLCATDQLLHVCVHGAQWDRPVNLRWIADAGHLLSRPDSRIDWEMLVDAAASRGVVLPLLGALRQLVDLLAVDIPRGALRALERSRVSTSERLRYYFQLRPKGRLGVLPLLVCQQWCHARRGHGHAFLGLPSYLKHVYEVDDPRQLQQLIAHARGHRALEPATEP